MTTIPTPAEFLLSPEPDEEYDAPFELSAARLDDLERRLYALETGGAQPATAVLEATACTECEELKLRLTRAEDHVVGLRATAEAAKALVEQIEGIVKKSTSKVSLDVKAAIEAWRTPDADKTPSPAPDASPSEPAVDEAAGTGAPAPDVLQASAGEGSSHLEAAGENSGAGVLTQPVQPTMGGFPGQPTRDAPVERWRSYARAMRGVSNGESSIDTMNRSQIRTLLGIEQPVTPAGA